MNVNLTDREQQVCQAAILFFYKWKIEIGSTMGSMNQYDLLSKEHTIATCITALKRLDPQGWSRYLQNPHPSQDQPAPETPIATLQNVEPPTTANFATTRCSCGHLAQDHASDGSCNLAVECRCKGFDGERLEVG